MIKVILKENRSVKREFIWLGRTLSLRNVTCQTDLLVEGTAVHCVGKARDAAEHLGMSKDRIVKKTVSSGQHIESFNGTCTLTEC
ncbi:hypothetical protein BG58_30895 [Caballeronia jiangsuensis]|nr:hypothetical protein BG58_30895 [Caballeronia jiangsuensis]